MSSDAESPPGSAESRLSIPPGRQVLVEREATGPPLSLLPDEAFENLLVVTTGHRPSEVEATVRERRGDPRTVGVVPITSTLMAYDGPLWTADRVGPGDLTGISVRVSQGFPHLEAGRGWIALDSLSTLLMYAEPGRVFRLIDWLVGNARAEAIRGVYTLQPGVVTDETLRRFRTIADEVVRR